MRRVKEDFDILVRGLQNEILEQIQHYDPKGQIQGDDWKRKDFNGNDGGGGLTRVFNGEVFENAGVNTSLIYGDVNPDFAKKLGSDDTHLWACGISLIIHPRNPRVPTVHANFRMIEAGTKMWFGGGADLTPYYPYEEDFIYFHKVWEKALRPYGLYERLKKECDEYFVNHHRSGEMRGIGGFFFDNFTSGDFRKDFDFMKETSKKFIESYFPIVERRFKEEWTPEDEDFQLHRRGRYVEFNLLHDRGTAFGLKSNGRTESILVSLPARCKFSYKYAPKKDSIHEKMMSYYRPIDWINSNKA
jgi:coproporphyrinogen III oxidase